MYSWHGAVGVRDELLWLRGTGCVTGCAALGGRLERAEPPVEQLVHGAVAVAGGGEADEGLALGVKHLVRVRVRGSGSGQGQG